MEVDTPVLKIYLAILYKRIDASTVQINASIDGRLLCPAMAFRSISSTKGAFSRQHSKAVGCLQLT